MGTGYHYSKSKIVFARLLELFFLPFKWGGRNYACNNSEKILIIEPYMLGDAALLAVMLDPLRKRFPNAEITMMVSPLAGGLFEDDPRVHDVLKVSFPWVVKKWNVGALLKLFKLLRLLRKRKFTIGIDVRGEIRNQVVMLLTGCGTRVGFTNYLCSNMTIRGRLLSHSLGNVALQHRTAINLGMCRLLGAEETLRLPALYAEKQGESPAKPYIVMHTGSSWEYSRWSKGKWGALIREVDQKFDIGIVLVGAPEEKSFLLELALLSKRASIRIASILELKQTLSGSTAFIGLDSGPMNVATMLNIPCIALFGPGVVEMYRPLSPGSETLHHQEEYTCAPCAKSVCVKPDATCTNAISVREVIRSLDILQ